MGLFQCNRWPLMCDPSNHNNVDDRLEAIISRTTQFDLTKIKYGKRRKSSQHWWNFSTEFICTCPRRHDVGQIRVVNKRNYLNNYSTYQDSKRLDSRDFPVPSGWCLWAGCHLMMIHQVTNKNDRKPYNCSRALTEHFRLTKVQIGKPAELS